MEYDKFIEISHGQHQLHLCRRANRGKDELKTFVLDAPTEDLITLIKGLVAVVDDPDKLSVDITGQTSDELDKQKEDALNLAQSLSEMLTRCYERQHNHPWHCLVGDPGGIHNATTDTAAALIGTAYLGEIADGIIEGNDGDNPNSDDAGAGPLFPPGTVIIDTP